MNLSPPQQAALEHLRATYAGPEGGEHEVIVKNNPVYQYVVGMLFPREASQSAGSTGEVTVMADTVLGDIEEPAESDSLAEAWRPSSTGISFVTDAEELEVDLMFGTYEHFENGDVPEWRRTPHLFEGISVTRTGEQPQGRRAGDVLFQIGSRWRPYGDNWLVTVHLRNLEISPIGRDDDATPEAKLQDAQRTMFQVGLDVTPAGGRILEYDLDKVLDTDPEAAELRLRFRKRKTFAVGHGLAANWTMDGDRCVSARLEAVPAHVVPAVEGTTMPEDLPQGQALRLDELARIVEDPEGVAAKLRAFADAFADWVQTETVKVQELDTHREPAERIVARARIAAERMGATIDLLADPRQGTLRSSFALAMKAMRLQMRQATAAKTTADLKEPSWRPFQLGFLLVSLSSTVDAQHPERELVDLIWFPTGGGKTEAYLGLAAVEMFRRRLEHGQKGGGTAVITRYTLRLLTSQQFQRSAALICAMETLRRTDASAAKMLPFTIGLWVGNEVTPGNSKDAVEALQRLFEAKHPQEANHFQVTDCPWCRTELVPKEWTGDRSRYGFREESGRVVVYCPRADCTFHDAIPLSVVDDDLYENPPTFLLGTVDKFARLQFLPEAGSMLGLRGTTLQPSLLIQDELHLLSGPLGTTVAVFEAVLQILLSRQGTHPKTVASTATIRASEEQIRGLYGRPVALYPPAGLDEDRSFFSQPVPSGEGRLYVGLMPQSLPQTTALIAAATPLLELPHVLVDRGVTEAVSDDYWTSVFYHNSLRELGRSETLIADDIDARLAVRAVRMGWPPRRLEGGRLIELTSRRQSNELRGDLQRMETRLDQSDEAIDIVLSSNMLSVGIDVSRLALMLMVGQPKTTSEYIQATSRVGRGEVPGVVVTLFRSNRARDRSQYESFRAFHQSLYRNVEPTSVTPWSHSSRKRSLAGALVMLVRQGLSPFSGNNDAGRYDRADAQISRAVNGLVDQLLSRVERADTAEQAATRRQVDEYLAEWHDKAQMSGARAPLKYEKKSSTDRNVLLRRFDDLFDGWLVADSMRTVEPSVAIEVQEPYERGK
ncbi:helicase-related protein [Arthrobacter sp. VKM Ac-2550]|uniref:helicase-related protein n=1 Tax=Crystallibacter permensis TaxID=1938888 RepID=UPI00222669EB|nr:helicase-related protein [Arthrobacter sp. VKM Ac-2550]MCW2135106.1 Helicase conserved C-terminal domain-containing protein [Arthrobacter sp. VKM Ac-2550]